MFCKWCGNTIKTTDKKCSSCGRETPPLSDCGGFYDLKRPWEAPMPPPEPTHTYMSAPTGPDPRVQQLENEKKGIIEEANKRHLIMLIICGALALALTISLIFHIVGGDDEVAPAPYPAGNGSQVESTGNGESEPAASSTPSDPTGESTPVETEPVETHPQPEVFIIDKDGERALYVGEGYTAELVASNETSVEVDISWEVKQQDEDQKQDEDQTMPNVAGSVETNNAENTGETKKSEKVSLTADWSEGLKLLCDTSAMSVFAQNENTAPETTDVPDEEKTPETEGELPKENTEPVSYRWQYKTEDTWTDITTKDAGVLTWEECQKASLNVAELRCIITVKNGEDTVLELTLGGFKIEDKALSSNYKVTFPLMESDLAGNEQGGNQKGNDSEIESIKIVSDNTNVNNED